MNFRKFFAAFLVLAALCACQKEQIPSATDPFPYPADYTEGKDYSVSPGDSFFDYCNGTWLKNNPIPAGDTNLGGLYAGDAEMENRLEELKKSVPDIGRFFALMDAPNAEAGKAYIQAQLDKIAEPKSQEDALRMLGALAMEGVNGSFMPTLFLLWYRDRLVALLIPPQATPPAFNEPNEEMELVPILQTKAEAASVMELVAEGMELNPSTVVTLPTYEPYWMQLGTESIEEIGLRILASWQSMLVADEMTEESRLAARIPFSYTLSYHFAQKFLTEGFKAKYEQITKEVQASLRKRISQVDWLSETTKNNALDKLDRCNSYVAYPDEWYMEGVASLSDCTSLTEAIVRCTRGRAQLYRKLIGTKDCFSYTICNPLYTSNNTYVPADLTLVNAMYQPNYNAVVIYPGVLMPPLMPEESVSEACYYAGFAVIGHEFTHGFDANGSHFDKYGLQNDWWTVADRMSFEERSENLINCYSHLELEPDVAGRSGTYGDGVRTQTEDLADLGGFLAVLDAYKAHLEEQGFYGEEYNDQLRKFYEAYAHFWRIQYCDEKFNILKTTDVHSHARLRVNGVVMNTDLWYELYDVDRNNKLYLPIERRTRIW